MSDQKPPTDPTLLEAALETRIYAAYIAGRASREVEAGLAENEFGLTASAIPLLHALRQGERTMAEISRQIPVAPSTLVPIVDALERGGLVRRGRDPRDRRRTPLSITERGLAALSSGPPMMGHAAIYAALQRMDPEKGGHLAALLRELVSIMGGVEITEGVAKALHLAMRNRPLPTDDATDPSGESTKEHQR